MAMERVGTVAENPQTVTPALCRGPLRHPSHRQRRQPQPHRKVVPRRVLPLDQIALPVAPPALEPLLVRDRAFHRLAGLEPDQPGDAVLLRVPLERAFAVLEDPRDQIRSHADIQRPVIAAREDVDAGNALDHRRHSLPPGGPRHKAGVTKKEEDCTGADALASYPQDTAAELRIASPRMQHGQHVDLGLRSDPVHDQIWQPDHRELASSLDQPGSPEHWKLPEHHRRLHDARNHPIRGALVIFQRSSRGWRKGRPAPVV
jgi:hypothetical protein